MSEPADYSDQAEIFRKSMVEALAKLDTVADQANKAYEQAVEDQLAAKQELERIKAESYRIADEYMLERRNEIEERIRKEVLYNITKTMIIDGRPAKDIYRWLKIPEQMMADAWMELGFQPLLNHVATVRYLNEGKSGEVIFYRDDIVIRFPYEFAGGNALVTVEIIPEEKWNAITGLPLEERMPIYEFIAERIIRDQAEGHQFKIENDSIIIFQ